MSSIHELFDGSEAQSLMTWRRYTGSPETLPPPFEPILIHKAGADGLFIGVFSGYLPDDVKPVWVAHNAVIGALPVKISDQWMPYPDPPKGDI